MKKKVYIRRCSENVSTAYSVAFIFKDMIYLKIIKNVFTRHIHTFPEVKELLLIIMIRYMTMIV